MRIKAQVAAEYLFIMLFALTILVGIVFVVGELQGRSADAARQEKVEELATYLQSELITAARVRDGYERAFYVEEDYRGNNIHVSGTNTSVVVRIKSATYARQTPAYETSPNPPYTHAPHTGWNYLVKRDGVITLS